MINIFEQHANFLLVIKYVSIPGSINTLCIIVACCRSFTAQTVATATTAAIIKTSDRSLTNIICIHHKSPLFCPQLSCNLHAKVKELFSLKCVYKTLAHSYTQLHCTGLLWDAKVGLRNRTYLRNWIWNFSFSKRYGCNE